MRPVPLAVVAVCLLGLASLHSAGALSSSSGSVDHTLQPSRSSSNSGSTCQEFAKSEKAAACADGKPISTKAVACESSTSVGMSSCAVVCCRGGQARPGIPFGALDVTDSGVVKFSKKKLVDDETVSIRRKIQRSRKSGAAGGPAVVLAGVSNEFVFVDWKARKSYSFGLGDDALAHANDVLGRLKESRQLVALVEEEGHPKDDPAAFRVTDSASSPYNAVGNIGESCSGTYVGDFVVLTAAHCLFELSTAEYYPRSELDFAPGQLGRRKLGKKNTPFGVHKDVVGVVIPKKFHDFYNSVMKGVYDEKVESADLRLDYGLILFGSRRPKGSSSLQIAKKAQGNTKVRNIGYPGDRNGELWQDSCTLADPTADAKYEGMHRCETAPGSSGSAMIDEAGNVCGVHVSGETDSSQGSNGATVLSDEIVGFCNIFIAAMEMLDIVAKITPPTFG